MTRNHLHKLTRLTVVVSTRKPDADGFRGVLHAVHKDCVVLHHAKLLTDKGLAPVKGELVIPREQVAYIQVVGG